MEAGLRPDIHAPLSVVSLQEQLASWSSLNARAALYPQHNKAIGWAMQGRACKQWRLLDRIRSSLLHLGPYSNCRSRLCVTRTTDVTAIMPKPRMATAIWPPNASMARLAGSTPSGISP